TGRCGPTGKQGERVGGGAARRGAVDDHAQPVPARVLTTRSPAADRPAPYDTHVLPALRPALPATDPGVLPDLTAESGRGLFLIHALADHVQLRTHPQRGATVSFDKILTAPLLRTAS
ncbi:hypothetical protein AB0O12_25920, partial [Kitasatospora griseola]